MNFKLLINAGKSTKASRLYNSLIIIGTVYSDARAVLPMITDSILLWKPATSCYGNRLLQTQTNLVGKSYVDERLIHILIFYSQSAERNRTAASPP
jgi:hypothetical protein